MKKLSKQEQEQWLLERRKGIGGSDIAAIVGLSKWKTPMDMWLDKTGRKEPSRQSLAMELGNFLEPLVVEKYRQATGNAVFEDVQAIRDEKHNFARCNIDGFVTTREGESGILEVKTAGNSKEWGDPGSDEIPKDYVCQCQWNMQVAGVQWCDVPVLFFDYGRRIEIYTVHADEDFQAFLMSKAKEFWQGVVADRMPAPTTAQEANVAFPSHNANSEQQATKEVVEAVEALRAIKKQEKSLRQTKDMLETKIKVFMENSERLSDEGKTIATWRSSKTSRFDQSQFKESHPELAKKFTSTSSIRRFLCK